MDGEKYPLAAGGLSTGGDSHRRNLLGLGLLLLLMKKGRRFNGQMFLSYVIWYGLGRAVIEGLRTDSLYFFGTPIRSSQMLGILSAAVGIGLYIVRRKTAGPVLPPFQPAAAAKNEAETEVSIPAAESVPERAGEAASASAEPVQREKEHEEEENNGGDTN